MKILTSVMTSPEAGNLLAQLPEMHQLMPAQRDRRMTADGKTVKLSPARRLLNKVVRRWESEGRKVYVWTPPVFVKDSTNTFNIVQ